MDVRIVSFMRFNKICSAYIFLVALFFVCLGLYVVGAVVPSITGNVYARFGSLCLPLGIILVMFSMEFARQVINFDTQTRFIIHIHDREEKTTHTIVDQFRSNMKESVLKITGLRRAENRVKEIQERHGGKPRGDVYAVIGRKTYMLTNVLSVEPTHLLLGFGRNLVLRCDSKNFDLNTGLAYAYSENEILKNGQILGDTLQRLVEAREQLEKSVPETSVEVLKKTIEFYDRGLREARISVGKVVPTKYILSETQTLTRPSWLGYAVIGIILVVVAVIVYTLL